MINLYYVVKKELSDFDEAIQAQHTTGCKTMTVYDIDTQSMTLIEVCHLVCDNSRNSQEIIQEWLKKKREKKEFKLIEL